MCNIMISAYDILITRIPIFYSQSPKSGNVADHPGIANSDPCPSALTTLADLPLATPTSLGQCRFLGAIRIICDMTTQC